MDKVKKTFEEIDLSGISLPVIALYGPNQIEYPGKYVARVFDLDKPTDTVIIRDTEPELIEQARVYASRRAMYYFPKGKDDDPSLIGCWI